MINGKAGPSNCEKQMKTGKLTIKNLTHGTRGAEVRCRSQSANWIRFEQNKVKISTIEANKTIKVTIGKQKNKKGLHAFSKKIPKT